MTTEVSDAGRLVERVDCPLCKSPRPYQVLRPASYPGGVTKEEVAAAYSASSDQVLFDQVVRCDACKLIYLNPRARAELIEQGYARSVDPTFLTQDEGRIRTFKRSLRRLCGRQGLTPSRDVRVLDVGCAGGAFPKAAHDLGFSVVGVEPSAWLASEGRRRHGLDLRAGTLEQQDLPASSFDLVTMWDVIEHLTRPDRVLAEARRVLAPDGLLAVNYPDHDGLVRRLMGWRWPFFLSVHLIYFTPRTLTLLLEQAGFEVLWIEPHWQTLELGYVLRRAEPILGAARHVRALVERLGLSSAPFTYNLSQSLCLARRRA